MNRDVTAQRATSVHPLSFLLRTEEGNVAMLQCYMHAIGMNES